MPSMRLWLRCFRNSQTLTVFDAVTHHSIWLTSPKSIPLVGPLLISSIGFS